MLLDNLGAVELTGSAAILIALVSMGFGQDAAVRRRLAAALVAWFVLVVALAATRALQPGYGVGVAGLGLAVAIPIIVLWASLLRIPTLRRGLDSVPLHWVTAVHAVRLLGINFVLLYADGRLPAPFAPVAGWGDIAVGAAALPVAWLVSQRFAGWRRVLAVWNAIGLADLAAAVILGVLSSPGPLRAIFAEPGTGLMTTLPWLLIPGFIVPLLATLHLASFYRLMRDRSSDERTSAKAAGSRYSQDAVGGSAIAG